MKKLSIILALIAIVLTAAVGFGLTASAAEESSADNQSQAAVSEQTSEQSAAETDASSTGQKAIAAAIAVGLAAALGTIGMGIAVSKSAESIARQPEASGKINSVMMLGLVFIETLVIYALIIAILIIFVL